MSINFEDDLSSILYSKALKLLLENYITSKTIKFLVDDGSYIILEYQKEKESYKGIRKLNSRQKEFIRKIGLGDYITKDSNGKGRNKLEIPIDAIIDKHKYFLLSSYDSYKWIFVPLTLISYLVINEDFYWMFNEGAIDTRVFDLYEKLDINRIIAFDLQLDSKITAGDLERYLRVRGNVIRRMQPGDEKYLKYEMLQMIVPFDEMKNITNCVFLL